MKQLVKLLLQISQ